MSREEVWDVVTRMYEAYDAGDRAGIDALLTTDATIWDSVEPALIVSRQQLDKVRDARPTDGPLETGLRAYDEVIDVWGDTALARYLLRVDFEEGEPEIVRTTTVLRRSSAGWHIVHVHENTL